MEKTSKELLELEHKDPSSFKESKLLVCGKSKKGGEERPISGGQPLTAPLPKTQVLGKVKDFLGVISEANKTLQLNAKDKPEEYDIEVLDGKESEYIEMDLMLGIADLHTPEAIAAAEAVVAGNQLVLNLDINGSSGSESSSDDDDDDNDDDDDDEEEEDDNDDDDDDDDDENGKADSSAGPTDMQEDGPLGQQSESHPKRKRPKIVELP